MIGILPNDRQVDGPGVYLIDLKLNICVENGGAGRNENVIKPHTGRLIVGALSDEFQVGTAQSQRQVRLFFGDPISIRRVFGSRDSSVLRPICR